MLIKTDDKLLLLSFPEVRVQDDCLLSLALSHQGIQKMLKVIQYRTHGDSLNQAQINWQGFIINRWLSSACFEPFSLNTSQGIFQGAQASLAPLPWTNADLSSSRVGWQQLHLHSGAGGVFAGCALWPRPKPRANVPHHPPVCLSVHPSVPTPWPPTSRTCWSSPPAHPPFPVPLGFFPKASGVERERSAPVSPFKVELSQS